MARQPRGIQEAGQKVRPGQLGGVGSNNVQWDRLCVSQRRKDFKETEFLGMSKS